MGSQALQASLAGGELAPTLWGRVDVARYGISLKTCRNFVVYPYGGVKNRAGSRYLGTVKDQTTRVRLIPFSFNTTQTYALEFGAGYIRIWSNGGQVVYPVGSSYGTPGQPVEIATPYGTADLPLLKFTQSADVMTIAHPSYPVQQLKRFANDHWTISAFNYQNGPFQTINSDLNTSMTVSKTTGVATVTCSKPIFTSAHVGLLLYLEQKDFGVPWEVNKTISIGDIRRSDGKYYQATSAGTTGTLRPINTVDIWNDGGVTWMFLHQGYGIGIIQAGTLNATPSATCSINILSRMPDSLLSGLGTPVTLTGAVGDGLSLNCTAAAFPSFVTGDTCNFTLTYNSITTGLPVTVTGSSVLTVIDATHINIYPGIVIWDGVTSDFASFVSGTVTDASLATTYAPTYKYAFGAWGPSVGYPSCVAMHQQRLCFGNNANQPQTIWMSRTGSFNDFGVSSPVLDDDAVTFTLASAKVDSIKSMLAMNRLMLLTAGGEWVVGNSAQDVVTPSNISCILQGYRGSSDLPPIGVGNTAIFLQRMGQVVRDLSYQFANDSFTGEDLTVFANHLVEGHTLTEWAYQQIPNTIVYAIRDDGILLGLTYMKEQQVVAWHRHDTLGTYESLCVISEGNEDVLYVVVNRTIGGATKRYVERIDTRVVTDIRDGFFVDAGLSYDGRVKTKGGVSGTTDLTGVTVTITGGTLWNETESLTVTSSAPLFAYPATTDAGDQLVFVDASGIAYRLTIQSTSSTTQALAVPNRILPVGYRAAARSDWWMARNTFSGLSHLEGQTVNILGDGNVQDQQVVSGGTIVINPPAYRVHVGLPITADLQTLDLSVPNIETIVPKAKAISAVRMLVNESRSIKAGRDLTHLFEVKVRNAENYDTPTNMFTGIAPVRIATSWGPAGDLWVRHDTPDPISILALIPEVSVGGAFS